ncbi:MAG: hypothetical protein RID53_36000 [Coleofasciculus sp. B1-GNL1-01]|uniref:hypothetical protein n=1 Tax=Coleofasciculus sp. B1-GNL1-01 TaxID=3068484 RepID=UPI0032F4007D
MPIILHRPIPEGFKLKTCTIVHKADGWYACISMEEATVPELLPYSAREARTSRIRGTQLSLF